MEQQKLSTQKSRTSKSYCYNWKEFIDKAMQILVNNPVNSRYIMKYNSKKHSFILKVTDGLKIAMKKCSADIDYDQIQRFTKLAARALSNESDKKAQQTQDEMNKDKKKKNKKKR